MLTIFAVPKPFKGHNNIIQRNAIKSWLLLEPKCEIILFFNEDGVAKTAKEFGILHVPDLEKNEFGTPFLNDAYNKAQKMAKNSIVAYLNSDIILMNDFIKALKKINFPSFMMSGRRWNLDIQEELDFENPEWEKKLRKLLSEKGRLYSPTAMDYCVFPRDFELNLPPFTVGRSGGSDGWQLYRARSQGLPIIDATEATTIVHQNHKNPSHNLKDNRKKIETERNLKLGGGFINRLTLRDAEWSLTRKGLEKRKINPLIQSLYRYFAAFLAHYLFFALWLKILLFPVWLGLKTIEKTRDLILKKGKFWLG